MVLLKLKGSLGNQLFQYCFGRSVAIDTNSKLIIDKSLIYKFKAQSYYSLNLYNIKATVLPFSTKYLPYKLLGKVGVKFYNIIPEDETKFYDENILRQINKSKGMLILNGYWQSYKYFESNWDTIKSEISLKDTVLNSYKLAIAQEIKSSNSISLHIRRGDYLQSPSHTSLKLDYYYKAVKILKKKGTERIFIFSDDLVWAKKNLNNLSNTVFVEQDIQYPQSDLYLMSLAKHNIIANSTFSWWGAWLNNNDGKKVIAPRNWFTDNTRNKYISDLIPQSWILI